MYAAQGVDWRRRNRIEPTDRGGDVTGKES